MDFHKLLPRPREVLMLEACLFGVQIGMALIGAVFNSGINRLLAEHGLVSAWGTTVGLIGACGFVLVLAEFLCGQNWKCSWRRGSYWLRGWANLFSGIAWLWLGHELFYYTDFNKAVFPLVLGPFFIVLHALCYITVRRVSVILDPQKDTTQMEIKLDRRASTLP